MRKRHRRAKTGSRSQTTPTRARRRVGRRHTRHGHAGGPRRGHGRRRRRFRPAHGPRGRTDGRVPPNLHDRRGRIAGVDEAARGAGAAQRSGAPQRGEQHRRVRERVSHLAR